MKKILDGKFMITSHGHWGSDNEPDEAQYVKIGMDRTSTRKSWAFGWGERNSCTPAELADFILANPRLFAGSVFRLETRGRDLIIKTVAPGAWIGSGGRWAKGMTACLKNSGRVNIQSIPSATGTSSSPFRFRFAEGWEDVFFGKVADKVVGHEGVTSQDNSHNYLGDVWGLDMPLPEVERLRKLAKAIDESARLRQERKYQESETLKAAVKVTHPNLYFGGRIYVIDLPKEWLEWSKAVAVAVADVRASGSDRKLQLGVYGDYLFVGGSCQKDNPADVEMVGKILAVVSPLGGDVVSHKGYDGQFQIVRK
ncbi:MAG: hypothetical protein PHC85_01595 [Candidatus Pacebacteria bacterium]|nr:hypothetical protein [Candidatus Paceibacterota bacterium]